MPKNIDAKLTLFLLFAGVVLLLTAGSFGVVETSDARYAEIGREMFRSGDWLHPLLLDIHHYHKPPITYQITALGYGLFGVTPFGARFFLQISVLLQVLLVYLIAKELKLGERVARWAALIYFSFPLVLASSRNLTTDSFLTTFVLAAIYSWIRFRREGQAAWLYAMSVLLGLGFLTKGPVVLIAPVLFALLWRPDLPKPKLSRRQKLLAFTLFVVISASWFLYLAWENPAFWNYFIERQTVERFSSNVFHRREPFWYYWVLTPLIGLPWLALLPWLLFRSGKAWRQDPLMRSLLLVTFIAILFFSLSTSKRIFYILPLFGFFALMTAMAIDALPKPNARRLLWMVTGYALLLTALLLLAPWLPLKRVTIPTEVALYALMAAFAIALIFRLRRLSPKSRAVLLGVVASTLLLLSATATLSRSPLSFKIADPVAGWIRSHHFENRTILAYDKRLPSLAFALDRPIVSLYDGDRSLNRETQFEQDERWKKRLYNLKDSEDRLRLRRLMEHSPYLLILYRKKLPSKREWLRKNTPHEEKMGKWTIYY